MIVAVPSGHWPIVDALAAEGFDVIHVDAHVRAFLAELDPPISGAVAMVNVGGSGRLSDHLDELRRSLLRWQQTPGVAVALGDEYRMTVSRYRDGDIETADHDLFDDAAERNRELPRMASVLRRLLPPPDFTGLDGDTVIVGVDTDEQRSWLPEAGVRHLVLSDRRPVWVSDVADVTVIDASMPRDAQAAASVAAVRTPVPV